MANEKWVVADVRSKTLVRVDGRLSVEEVVRLVTALLDAAERKLT
jgi:hypothetical protein